MKKEERMSSTTPVLEATDLSFSYGPSVVWRDVDVVLDPGEIAVLQGANGAGKSTLLHCLAGWCVPDTGSIRVCGTPVGGAARGIRREIALVTDTPPFFDDLTAVEHVRFVLRANRRGDRESEALELLTRFGLEDAGAAFPFSFSRGMRYKLALVMALALEPSLLLLDEPFGPLDTRSCDVLASELASASSRGAAVLLSGHQLPATLGGHSIRVLDGGTLRASRQEVGSENGAPSTPGEAVPDCQGVL